MKTNLYFLAVLCTLVACGKADLSSSERTGPAVNPEQTPGEEAARNLPTLPMSVKALTPSAAPIRATDDWTFPSVIPINNLLTLITWSNSTDLSQVRSINALGVEVYSTKNNLDYFELSRYFLAHEYSGKNHEFFFISNNSIDGFQKKKLQKLSCEKNLTINQSSDSKLLMVSCEADGKKLIVDYLDGDIQPMESYKGSSLDLAQKGEWYKAANSNSSHRSLLHMEKDFKSPFTPISDKVVLPLIHDSFSTTDRYTVAGLNTKTMNNFSNHDITFYDSQKTDNIVIPMKLSVEDPKNDYEVSYFVTGSSESNFRTVILKEEIRESSTSRVNLVSFRPPFGKPIRLSNDLIIAAFCKKSIQEGRVQKDPLAYQHCENYDVDKLAVDGDVTLFDTDKFLVQISTSSPVISDSKGKHNYRGAMIMDSNLQVLRTLSMVKEDSGYLKFMGNSSELYVSNATNLSKINADGEIESTVDFCALIPKCRRDQVKTIISLNSGRFAFVQGLVHTYNVSSNELIYQLQVR